MGVTDVLMVVLCAATAGAGGAVSRGAEEVLLLLMLWGAKVGWKAPPDMVLESSM